jgi:hypothetical protein
MSIFSPTLEPFQRIRARLALDDVAAVARVPDERVVAVAEQGHVVAAPAVNVVIAVTTQQRVIAFRCRR